MPAPAERIWLPGLGTVDLDVAAAMRAVKEYDENLDFGRNEDTGDWCVFLCRRGEQPLPVLGFGNVVPGPQEIQRRLYQADALRRGNEILDEVIRSREEQEEAREAAAREADAILAETAQWGFEREGKASYSKVVLGEFSRTNRMGRYS